MYGANVKILSVVSKFRERDKILKLAANATFNGSIFFLEKNIFLKYKFNFKNNLRKQEKFDFTN